MAVVVEAIPAAVVISVTGTGTCGTVIVIGIAIFGILEMVPLLSVVISTGIGVAVGIAILTTGIHALVSVVVVPAPRRLAISVT